ncbi:MAG: deoxyribose-phosphate aldolase [Flavobacterium sp.]|nr:deoxyribose-phosphate aldolase [Flavobacterium sp.]
MNIKSYLDSTYLKTSEDAGISESENKDTTLKFIQEAIDEKFKLIMIRPEFVSIAKKMIIDSKSKVTIGTVISFPDGKNSTDEKYLEAIQAINNGADDLDFVINYEAFKNGDIHLIKNEVLTCTRLGVENNKIVKWIIEVAALNNDEIIKICALIKNIVIANFKEDNYANVFVKSSTGFFKTNNNTPNGATIETLIVMLENASPLSIKASGGIKTTDDALQMIRLGIKRIGTSSAKAIANNESITSNY